MPDTRVKLVIEGFGEGLVNVYDREFKGGTKQGFGLIGTITVNGVEYSLTNAMISPKAILTKEERKARKLAQKKERAEFLAWKKSNGAKL